MLTGEYKAISMRAEVCIAVEEIERTRFSMSEKKELTLWMLKYESWGHKFYIKEVEATETAKQYQYVDNDSGWKNKGRINKCDMADGCWAGESDKYVGLSRNAVIERFISVHETEVRRLKLRIEAEEDILKEAKKLLEE